MKVETRVGVVMYGGVSLAIYENGVAQEIFNAVHGNGVYALVQRLANTKIVVDTISGTSAGGINGILLAFALANGGDFKESASLWRQHGDLLRLLRKPSDAQANSVLDSEGVFQPRLVEAFRSILSAGTHRHAIRCPEIDLYITGTNVQGSVFTTCDDFGHPIDVKDHRSVFKLSFRDGRKNEFGADAELPQVQMQDRIDALATLSRITSCFPVAFAPVVVNPVFEQPAKGDAHQVEFLLTRWGQLKTPCAFLDGGVLDNKPFSYTIDGIFSRTADGPVDRIMFYVEPDPERFASNKPVTQIKPPNVLQAAIDALITIPGYESISADLRSIAARNNRLSHYQEMRAALGYLQSPADHRGLQLEDLNDSDPTRYAMYCVSRLAQLRAFAIDSILKKEYLTLRVTYDERRAAKALADSFNEWEGDGRATLDEFDIYYRQRRTAHLVYALRELIGPQVEDEGLAHYRELLQRLNVLSELQEVIRHAMQTTLDRFDFGFGSYFSGEAANSPIAERCWERIQYLLRHLLNREVIDKQAFLNGDRNTMQQTLARLRCDLVDRRSALLSRGEPAPIERAPNLIDHFEQLERELVDLHAPGVNDPIRVEFSRFVWIDANLFPIEYSGGIVAKDVLRTVRISPIDARYGCGCDKSVAEKLCGDMLGHFAGFLKRSWRSNDIMWGRLDAVAQLLETLLPVERLMVLALGQVSSLKLCEIFPSAAPQDLDQLKQKLAAVAQAPDRSGAEDVLRMLIDIAQAEILHEEIPNILHDTIEQQREWNAYDKPVARALPQSAKMVRPPFDTATGRWTVGVRFLDKALMDYAAAELLARRNGPAPAWLTFFDKYSVGKEIFPQHIPGTVLLEMGTRTALVLRNCLLGVIPEGNRAGVKSSALFRLGVDLPLRVLHAVAALQRGTPEVARIVVAMTATACVILLVVALYFSSSIDKTSERIGFALLPVVVLLTLAITGLSRIMRWIGRGAWRAACVLGVLGMVAFLTATTVLALAIEINFLSEEAVKQFFGAGLWQYLGPWSGMVVHHASRITTCLCAAAVAYCVGVAFPLTGKSRAKHLQNT